MSWSGDLSGSMLGSQRTSKWTPGAFQDALAAQLLPDAVSGPVFTSISTPPESQKSFLKMFLKVFLEILLPASGPPNASQNEPKMLSKGGPGGFQSVKNQKYKRPWI